MNIKNCDSYCVKIYIAGCYSIIKQACHDFVKEQPLCINLKRVEYIYTGGEESGVVIEIINYARFPKTEAEINNTALSLGNFIKDKANQKSFSIVTPTKSTYINGENLEHG